MGAFFATVILISAMFGFAVICLSKELYMPGRFEPMLQINRIDASGLYFTAMGNRHMIPAVPLRNTLDSLEPWRLLLPVAPQWAALLAEEGYSEIRERQERAQQAQEAYNR